MKPYQQGDFNGLCGLYAVLNAILRQFEMTGLEQLHEEMFKVGATAIPKNRFPDVLWDGMDVADLFRIAKAVGRFLRESRGLDVVVWKPFERRRFANVTAYVEELDGIWSERKASFVIGVDWAGGTNGHWTVLDAIGTDALDVLDSASRKSLSRRALTTKRVPNKHRLCPEQTVAFALVAIGGEAV